MSTRGGRRRGRPPKSSYSSPHFLNVRSNVIEKPKWLLSRDGVAHDNGPSGSRASSPGGSVGSFTQQYSAKKHISVTPFKKRGRKAGTRGNRGGKAYVPRPSLVITRGNDYHYGSDFDSGSDSDGPPSQGEDVDLDVESDVDIPISEPESDELDDAASDISFSNHSSSMRKIVESSIKSIPTPLPFWLQSDRELPVLTLPKSSEDLLLPSHQVLPACAIYEVLRKFSSEVRLSPFRFEDFMAALQSEEMTPLLAEVHVQLLKAMLREEDVQQTWFGPLDQKDSTNSMLNFGDTLTWPEVMRVYLQSDPTFAPALSLLESCEYPFTSCDVRLSLLKFLTDHFLCNTAVRQEFLSEGNIKYNDHCRVCHKVGDLLCCETCPAVYHLHCLDPPLEHVPNEDWQCPICTAQLCKGVTDCISDVERSGFLCRQDCLGYDRHGRKYWFIARRVFVEETGSREEFDGVEETAASEPRKTWYYSSPHQFEQLLAVLDKTEYERALCQELYNLRPEILRQMAITVQLTNEQKGNNKSYLELDEEAARAAAQTVVKVEKEEEDVEEKLSVDTIKTESEKVETEEVVEECGVEVDDDFMQQLHVESEDKPKVESPSDETTTTAANGTYSTRSKTGTIATRTYVDIKRRTSTPNGGGTTIKEENTTTAAKSKSPLPADVVFKLGMEGRHKTYVNQYSSNPLALNKNQASEERDRKRYLSHKFSLTGCSEFKWSGSTFGNRAVMLQTVRSTLLQLHSQLPAIFMHPNWTTMRKSWVTAVNACVSSRDLGRVLSVLAACIRPVVFTLVWHEALGHIRLQRQTALEREERKKVDKKEKKDKELEEEMHRLHTVHYTKGLKHQIWKHKGEEFRLHGQWGWRWLSATRPLRRLDARQCGLRAGPWRMITCSQGEDGKSTYIQCEPSAGSEIYLIPSTDPLMEVVDVCLAMNDSDRRVYPKIAKKGKLDSMLDWRLKLKAAEEKNLLKVEAVLPIKAIKTEKEEVDDVPKLTLKEMESRLEQLRLHRRNFPRCYSHTCGGDQCYSPTCRAIQPLSLAIAKEKEEEEKRKAALVKKRIYSNESTAGPLSLKRLLTEDEARTKKKRVPVKYPMMSTYMTKSKKRTIFVLPDHELRHLARRHGQGYVQGFHHGSKNNSTAWIYPSARPVFKTCWFFRTNGLQSLSAAALQLRILWACLRWDDMAAKAGNMGMADGKNQTTTDTEIVTTDILKHRHVGRFLERTQYFQRRVVIPLDVPKTVREVTPSRSGLRKRKMVEAPKLSQPIVTEEWVDEDRLDLWVIKHYHERIEKAAAAAAAGATTPGSQLTRLKGTAAQAVGPGGKPLSMEELKAQAEQQLRAQRAAHQLKSATGTPGTPGIVRLALPANKVVLPGNKTLASLVTTPSGTVASPLGRRILITKDGKTSQIVKTTAAAAAAASASGSVQPVLIAPSPGVAAATPMTSKLQITRGPDGKVQIRGLQPGQQLIRMGDGRLTIVSPSPTLMAAQPAPAQAQTLAQSAAANDGTATKTIVVQKGATVTTVAGQKTSGQIVLPAGTNTAMVAQQLASGKLTLGTVNGQQVLIQTNNIPSPAGTVVVTKAGDTPTATAAGQPQQAKQAVILQTPQGQRIVVQNLQGGSLTPQQLAAIQEQLKSQLSRVQQGGNNKPITIAVRTSTATTTAAVATTAVTTSVAPVTATSGAATTVTTPSTTTTTTAVPASAASTTTPAAPTSPAKSDKQFVVTPDFIQQTIRKALKQENLHPDIEQKLLQLQRFQEKQKRDDGEVETPTYFATPTTIRKRTVSGASWNEELEPATPVSSTPGTDSKTARPQARKIVRIIEAPSAPVAKSVAGATPVSDAVAEQRDQKNKERAMKAAQRAKERRHQSALARLQGVLGKHSELLKKEMLRKRALLEKELRVSIQKEISALRLPSPVRPAPSVSDSPSVVVKKEQQSVEPPCPVKASPARPQTATATQRKRKISSIDKLPPVDKIQARIGPDSEDEDSQAPSPTPVAVGKRKRKRNSSEGGGGGGAGGGKKKLYCICRKPYDNSKFYVGCDLCSNWFHGDCVGITEAMSQTMSEFVCDACKKAQQTTTRELYCLCRQPYDESQFYICCDRCQDWFHGRCVGVLQTESESIDEYKCPNCEPQAAFNYANMRTLSTRDYEELRKLLRQLQTHKSSWPFREPVKEKDVPDYYQIIKDPMDLRLIETKIQERRYQRLLEFIGDVTKIFDNCRYYNAKESNIARCATSLESFFVPRLKMLRSSMTN